MGESIISVQDENNKRLPGYTIVAALNMVNLNYSKIKIDYVSSDDPNDRFLVLSEFKSVKTDSTGNAHFNTLGVMDVEEKACIQF